ncbi:PH domain-containing protein [Agarivorans sp. 1_MG-2023]|uniref:PH domain-containing protein n=1 Tax=Agarivorans sp. 1_MG-2023 TaxID=3062634 RepID=UPI0026E42E86|nr:PH domain-containing protein [Agarivorans sp. 1_MG-2023]MDO6765197.1 PH domain-containing protein [Agarivorans sp. 1_MG-2023]
MNKEQAQEYIKDNLNEGDALIGFFQAISPPNIWLFFLIGPLFVLSMKSYFLAVTEKGISFHKLSMLGKFKEHDFFEFDEIESVKIGKGLLQRPMKFTFKNNRKVTVKAQLKGVEKIAKLLPDVQQHIEKNIPLVQ